MYCYGLYRIEVEKSEAQERSTDGAILLLLPLSLFFSGSADLFFLFSFSLPCFSSFLSSLLSSQTAQLVHLQLLCVLSRRGPYLTWRSGNIVSSLASFDASVDACVDASLDSLFRSLVLAFVYYTHHRGLLCSRTVLCDQVPRARRVEEQCRRKEDEQSLGTRNRRPLSTKSRLLLFLLFPVVFLCSPPLLCFFYVLSFPVYTYSFSRILSLFSSPSYISLAFCLIFPCLVSSFSPPPPLYACQHPALLLVCRSSFFSPSITTPFRETETI